MFRRTRVLLEEVKKPKQLLDLYKPNDHLIDSRTVPYELRGEHLPRQKINPYRKKPLKVTYDQASFNRFILPSLHENQLGCK